MKMIIQKVFNKIYFFASENLNFFPNIKLINLNKNNFSFPENFIELYENLKNKEDVLILFVDNLFLFKNNKLKFYFDYLINKINSNKFFYNLEQINLQFFFNENKIFNKINFNTNFLFSIKKLNLSFCNLNNENVINLLMKNFCLFNIKKLILKNNFLDNKILNVFITNKINIIFNKLKILDFSGNSNFNFNFDNFKNFFLKFHCLKTLILSKTNFQKDFSDFIKKNIKKFYFEIKKTEENKTKNNNNEIKFNEKDKKLEEFFNFLFENNINTKIQIDSSDIRKTYYLKLKKNKKLLINNINFIERINYKD